MKIISDYILDVFIVLYISIIIILMIIQNYNYSIVVKNHYHVLNELKESSFIKESIEKLQSDVITIKKESDNVYEIISEVSYDFPLILYHDDRTLKDYVYVQEWQK